MVEKGLIDRMNTVKEIIKKYDQRSEETTNANLYYSSLVTNLIENPDELKRILECWIELDAEEKIFPEIGYKLESFCKKRMGYSMRGAEMNSELLRQKLTKLRTTAGEMTQETDFIIKYILKIPLNLRESFNDLQEDAFLAYRIFIEENEDKEVYQQKFQSWVDEQIKQRKFHQN